jgi:hypothetical protein
MNKLAPELYDAAFKYLGTKIDGTPVIPRDFASRLLPKLKTSGPKDKVVAEFLYYYVAPKGSKVWSIPVTGETNPHYFTEWPNEIIVDVLLEKYDTEKLNWGQLKKVKVAKTPSEDVIKFAAMLGYTDDDLDTD